MIYATHSETAGIELVGNRAEFRCIEMGKRYSRKGITMHYVIARIKSLPRWVAFKLGAEYKEYGELSDVPGYDGWYEWRGHCVAFRKDNGRVQFAW